MKTGSLTIRSIADGSAADRDGRMKVGDRLLAIDNIKLSNASLEEANLILEHLSSDARFAIEYDVCIMDSVDNVFGPLLVELEKLQGLPLGISIAFSEIETNAVIIESIKQASIADRCGALHVNDQILAINDIAVNHMSLPEVAQMLQFSVNDKLKLQILPIGQLYLKQISKIPMITSGYSTSSNYIALPQSWMHTNNRTCLQTQGSSSNVSLASDTTTICPSNRISRPETIDVTLHNSYYTYGFAIQQGISAGGLTSCMVITNIDPDGPAARTNVIQVGDRLLAVNGQSVKIMTVEEVTKLIMESQPTVKLLVEFDVSEYLFFNSCTFIVKVAKLGRELGITITSSQNNFDHSLLIADVKKGSTAYRTGIIHPGDYIIAINGLRTDSCTPENAAHILQTCGKIVKLYIRKGKLEDEAEDGFCYSVEIARRGRPLGLTMSGSENPFDPIIITNLIQGGLAEQCGGLHIGDRIIAINGITLHGKTLSETIGILQNSEDLIKLKIQKKTDTDCSSEKVTTIPDLESPSDELHDLHNSSERLSDIETNKDINDEAEWENVIKKFEDCTKQLNDVCLSSNLTTQKELKQSTQNLPEPLLQSKNTSVQQVSQYSCRRSPEIAKYSYYPVPVELYTVTLFKDKIYEDFGFSVSDGAYEQGVYINRIRPDGPADLCGILQPSDRIMQVNGVNTLHYDCCLTVPLMAAAGDKIELIVARSPFGSPQMVSSTDISCQLTRF